MHLKTIWTEFRLCDLCRSLATFARANTWLIFSRLWGLRNWGVNHTDLQLRAAHADAPNLAYLPQWRLPTTDIKPLARSKCRRRRRGAPPCRRRARGGGRFPVLLPLRARIRLWFGTTKHFRVGQYMANRRSINSKTLAQWVFYITFQTEEGRPSTSAWSAL